VLSQYYFSKITPTVALGQAIKAVPVIIQLLWWKSILSAGKAAPVSGVFATYCTYFYKREAGDRNARGERSNREFFSKLYLRTIHPVWIL